MRAFLSAAAIVGSAIAAQASAATYVTTGTTVGGPTYNRALDANNLSSVGTNVNYDVFAFTVDASTTYTLELTTGFDSYLSLYAGSFYASNALTNLVARDDDNGSGSDALIISGLLAGTSYFAVVSAFDNNVAGAYSLTINGLGNVTPGAGAVVPEPATWGLMALGFGLAGAAMRRRKSAVVSA